MTAPTPLTPANEPVIDICQHPPRYMVRCSTCGIFAEMQTPAEAVELRASHRCSSEEPWYRNIPIDMQLP